MSSSKKFDLDTAVKEFPRHLKNGENLLNANLVSKPLRFSF